MALKTTVPPSSISLGSITETVGLPYTTKLRSVSDPRELTNRSPMPSPSTSPVPLTEKPAVSPGSTPTIAYPLLPSREPRSNVAAENSGSPYTTYPPPTPSSPIAPSNRSSTPSALTSPALLADHPRLSSGRRPGIWYPSAAVSEDKESWGGNWPSRPWMT